MVAGPGARLGWCLLSGLLVGARVRYSRATRIGVRARWVVLTGGVLRLGFSVGGGAWIGVAALRPNALLFPLHDSSRSSSVWLEIVQMCLN